MLSFLGSHVLKRMIRSPLQCEMYNLQACAEGGDMIRAAIGHIDNKLGEKELEETIDLSVVDVTISPPGRNL